MNAALVDFISEQHSATTHVTPGALTAPEALWGCSRCADGQENAAPSPVHAQGRICMGRAPAGGTGGQRVRVSIWGDGTKEVSKFTLTAGCELTNVRRAGGVSFSHGVYVWPSLTVDAICSFLRRNEVRTLLPIWLSVLGNASSDLMPTLAGGLYFDQFIVGTYS